MLFVLLVLGGCSVQQKAVVQQVQQAYAVQSAVVQAAYPVAYFTYAVGDSERLAKLEEIAAQNATILQQQQTLMASLSGLQPVVAQDAGIEVLKEHCLKCHAGASPAGKLNLTGDVSIGVRLRAWDMIESGEMPPDKDLTNEELQELRQWAKGDRAKVKAFYQKGGE